jgi:hypothetical protein
MEVSRMISVDGSEEDHASWPPVLGKFSKLMELAPSLKAGGRMF